MSKLKTIINAITKSHKNTVKYYLIFSCISICRIILFENQIIVWVLLVVLILCGKSNAIWYANKHSWLKKALHFITVLTERSLFLLWGRNKIYGFNLFGNLTEQSKFFWVFETLTDYNQSK